MDDYDIPFDMPPAVVFDEVKQIMCLLSDFCKGDETMSESLNLISKSRPYLNQIRKKLGAENFYYLNLSSLIANTAMSYVVKAVNDAQKNIDTREGYERKIRISLAEAMLEYGFRGSKLSNSSIDDILNRHTDYNTWVRFHNAQVDQYHSVLKKAWKVVQQIDRLDIDKLALIRYN